LNFNAHVEYGEDSPANFKTDSLFPVQAHGTGQATLSPEVTLAEFKHTHGT
jgi:hypothetical protein